MTSSLIPDQPLREFFAGLVEEVFHVELGVADPKLTAYLGDLLADSVHMDHIYRLRDVDHTVIRDLSKMEANANLGPDVDGTRRRCVVNRLMGDFTLFWAGVYPENLSPRRQGVDRLREYLLQGRRSYGIASELTGVEDAPPADVLANLSEQFEFCVHGLRLVRAGWEHMGDDSVMN